jgi:hypothetical protein
VVGIVLKGIECDSGRTVKGSAPITREPTSDLPFPEMDVAPDIYAPPSAIKVTLQQEMPTRLFGSANNGLVPLEQMIPMAVSLMCTAGLLPLQRE